MDFLGNFHYKIELEFYKYKFFVNYWVNSIQQASNASPIRKVKGLLLSE
jgi:hypothetical protein